MVVMQQRVWVGVDGLRGRWINAVLSKFVGVSGGAAEIGLKRILLRHLTIFTRAEVDAKVSGNLANGLGRIVDDVVVALDQDTGKVGPDGVIAKTDVEHAVDVEDLLEGCPEAMHQGEGDVAEV